MIIRRVSSGLPNENSTWFSTRSFKIVNPASCSSLCQQFLQVHLRPRRQISASLTGPALIHDSRQSLVRPDRRILKLPHLLPRRWRSLPLELPCESSRKRSGDDTQGVPGKLGILLGGFRESKAVQLRVDLNRLHAIIIPSQMENGGIREVWKIGPSRDCGAMDPVCCGGSNSHLASRVDVKIIWYQCFVN